MRQVGRASGAAGAGRRNAAVPGVPDAQPEALPNAKLVSDPLRPKPSWTNPQMAAEGVRHHEEQQKPNYGVRDSE